MRTFHGGWSRVLTHRMPLLYWIILRRCHTAIVPRAGCYDMHFNPLLTVTICITTRADRYHVHFNPCWLLPRRPVGWERETQPQLPACRRRVCDGKLTRAGWYHVPYNAYKKNSNYVITRIGNRVFFILEFFYWFNIFCSITIRAGCYVKYKL